MLEIPSLAVALYKRPLPSEDQRMGGWSGPMGIAGKERTSSPVARRRMAASHVCPPTWNSQTTRAPSGETEGFLAALRETWIAAPPRMGTFHSASKSASTEV